MIVYYSLVSENNTRTLFSIRESAAGTQTGFSSSTDSGGHGSGAETGAYSGSYDQTGDVGGFSTSWSSYTDTGSGAAGTSTNQFSQFDSTSYSETWNLTGTTTYSTDAGSGGATNQTTAFTNSHFSTFSASRSGSPSVHTYSSYWITDTSSSLSGHTTTTKTMTRSVYTGTHIGTESTTPTTTTISFDETVTVGTTESSFTSVSHTGFITTDTTIATFSTDTTTFTYEDYTLTTITYTYEVGTDTSSDTYEDYTLTTFTDTEDTYVTYTTTYNSSSFTFGTASSTRESTLSHSTSYSRYTALFSTFTTTAFMTYETIVIAETTPVLNDWLFMCVKGESRTDFTDSTIWLSFDDLFTEVTDSASTVSVTTFTDLSLENHGAPSFTSALTGTSSEIVGSTGSWNTRAVSFPFDTFTITTYDPGVLPMTSNTKTFTTFHYSTYSTSDFPANSFSTGVITRSAWGGSSRLSTRRDVPSVLTTYLFSTYRDSGSHIVSTLWEGWIMKFSTGVNTYDGFATPTYSTTSSTSGSAGGGGATQGETGVYGGVFRNLVEVVQGNFILDESFVQGGGVSPLFMGMVNSYSTGYQIQPYLSESDAIYEALGAAISAKYGLIQNQVVAGSSVKPFFAVTYDSVGTGSVVSAGTTTSFSWGSDSVFSETIAYTYEEDGSTLTSSSTFSNTVLSLGSTVSVCMTTENSNSIPIFGRPIVVGGEHRAHGDNTIAIMGYWESTYATDTDGGTTSSTTLFTSVNVLTVSTSDRSTIKCKSIFQMETVFDYPNDLHVFASKVFEKHYDSTYSSLIMDPLTK